MVIPIYLVGTLIGGRAPLAERSGPMTDEARATIAQACRILAMEVLVEGVLGHVSLRTGDDRMLIRCRGRDEHGLMFTTDDDIRLTDLDGQIIGADDGYATPKEQIG